MVLRQFHDDDEAVAPQIGGGGGHQLWRHAGFYDPWRVAIVSPGLKDLCTGFGCGAVILRDMCSVTSVVEGLSDRETFLYGCYTMCGRPIGFK
jgi:hypothetical protein